MYCSYYGTQSQITQSRGESADFRFAERTWIRFAPEENSEKRVNPPQISFIEVPSKSVRTLGGQDIISDNFPDGTDTSCFGT